MPNVRSLLVVFIFLVACHKSREDSLLEAGKKAVALLDEAMPAGEAKPDCDAFAARARTVRRRLWDLGERYPHLFGLLGEDERLAIRADVVVARVAAALDACPGNLHLRDFAAAALTVMRPTGKPDPQARDLEAAADGIQILDEALVGANAANGNCKTMSTKLLPLVMQLRMFADHHPALFATEGEGAMRSQSTRAYYLLQRLSGALSPCNDSVTVQSFANQMKRIFTTEGGA